MTLPVADAGGMTDASPHQPDQALGQVMSDRQCQAIIMHGLGFFNAK